MKAEHDLHLAAGRISRPSIERLTQIGFERDHFANLTCCHTGEYHATYHGPVCLPDDNLWQEICSILQADEVFSGYLEEEATGLEFRQPIEGKGTGLPVPLPPVPLSECGPELHKACDVHIGINITVSSPEAIAYMAKMQTASVDKPIPDGIRRVYTITFEDLRDGKTAFRLLAERLLEVPGLIGRIKFEAIRRYLRKPDDAATLPIVTRPAAAQWLREVASSCRTMRATDEANFFRGANLLLF